MGKRKREGSEGNTGSSDLLFSFSSDYRDNTRGKEKELTKKRRGEKGNNKNNNNKSDSDAESTSDASSLDGFIATRNNLSQGCRNAVTINEEQDEFNENKTYGYNNCMRNGENNLKSNGQCVKNQNEAAVRLDENVDFDDDPFGSSVSTSSESNAGEKEDDDDDDAVVAEFRERLLLHARVTSAAKVSSSSSFVNKGSFVVRKTPENALSSLKEELLKPVMSTALTVVSATDESDDVIAELVSAKLPPPPPEDARRLRKLQYVDHSSVNYRQIRKDFYIALPDVNKLNADELKNLLKELDGAKVRGRDPPRPMRSWIGTGLPDSVLDVLSREGYQQPFAVQSIGCPALMSGRDLLITAKTGSGKTLAYLLPLIRHCLGQEPCGKGEGPIGLVLVPTHELASQIFHIAEKLCVAARLKLVASYGLTLLSDNIKQCKAGSEVMVCTPGRLLDLLTVNNGSVLSLQRVSFVIVDEADRMFDSGFMEHVEAFLKNIRPDRQLGLISATMPKELKKVIMHHLRDPVEITVGGKPTPASNVEQRFFFFDEEVYEADEINRSEDRKFLKLLQILGDEGGNGEHLVMIFAQRKEECDELFARLSACGYQRRIAVLYSGMDALDREFALEYFSPGNQFILIATGVAERGLDIPYLELVINYTLPDHYEAYVHRIGRTGRAGKKGKAVSFFTRGRDDDISIDLCEGLERAQQHVPEELYERAVKLREKRKEGFARHNSGFYKGYLRGKKLHLSDRNQKEQLKAAARAAGVEEYLSFSSCSDSDASNSDDDDDAIDGDGRNAKLGGDEIKVVAVPENSSGAGKKSTAVVLHKNTSALTLSTRQQQQEDRIASALAYAQKTTEAAVDPAAVGVRFEAEYPINDLPDSVRRRMQSAAFLRAVAEETATTIIRKGVFFDKKYRNSHRLQDGVRPLYLLIIGKTAEAVRDAANKLNEAKTEALGRIQKKVSSLGAEL